MTRLRAILLALLGVTVAVSLVALWWSSDSQQADRAQDRARSLWESQEPAAYSFVYGECSGMCAGCRLRITVEHGQVTSAADTSGRCSGYGVDDVPTIEGVFTAVEWSRKNLGGRAEISYDPTWGFPASAQISCPPGASDCGSSYEVTDFQELSSN
jgi:nitrogen fixation-related uncharacterized protein